MCDVMGFDISEVRRPILSTLLLLRQQLYRKYAVVIWNPGDTAGEADLR